MDEATKVRRLRELLPVTQRVAYLNTGSVGPLPTPVAEVMREWSERELREGRAGAAALQAAQELRARARTALAGLVGADPSEIALTHFTTEGINIVVWGIDWRPGDEIVISNLEHPAVFLPAWAVEQRLGVKVVVADLGLGDRDPVTAVAAALSERTRLVVLSHVAYCTGALLPVAEIAHLAHEHGVPLLVDGAQAVGALPVDVGQLGVDFYAIPGQKWLLGPEDTGALYVHREHLATLRQTFVGYASMAQMTFGQPFVPHADARRFEVGSRNAPAIAGQAASVTWLREEVGVEWAQARAARLVARARAGLAEIPGVRVVTPPACAGLLAFTVAGAEPERLAARLDARGVIIRSLRAPRALRASFGFFNTEEDVDRLLTALRAEVAAL